MFGMQFRVGSAHGTLERFTPNDVFSEGQGQEATNVNDGLWIGCNQSVEYFQHVNFANGEQFSEMSPFAIQRTKKIHVCHYCSKEFTSVSKLNRHKVIHTGEKPFSCDFCESKFAHQSNKRIHMAIHTGNKPFACQFCDKSFPAKNQLKDHLVKHTGEKSYKCDTCEMAFAHRFSLRQHRLLKHPVGETITDNYENYRPFTCDICMKKFTQLSSLKTHKRLHTGLKPYCCSVCGKCFPRKDTLTRHQFRHSDVRPFKCEHCDKSFATRYMLKQHAAGHSFDKASQKLVCTICGLKLASEKSLSRHISKHARYDHSAEQCRSPVSVI